MYDSERSQSVYDKLQKIKIVLVGDQGVGKTCLLARFTSNKFDMNTNSTIGVDFIVKTFTQNDMTYKFHFWDTAGQERFHSLIPSYIKNCQVAVMIYDVTNLQSFKNLQNWYNIIMEEKHKDVILAIVGTKTDLVKVVSTDEALAFAKSHNALFQECSAKTGDKVETFFNFLCETVIKSRLEKELEREREEFQNLSDSFEDLNEKKNTINLNGSEKKKCC